MPIEGFGFMARSFAPHLFNPFNLNPLREALAEEVDFAKLRRECRDQADGRRDPGA